MYGNIRVNPIRDRPYTILAFQKIGMLLNVNTLTDDIGKNTQYRQVNILTVTLFYSAFRQIFIYSRITDTYFSLTTCLFIAVGTSNITLGPALRFLVVLESVIFVSFHYANLMIRG